jgi:hypothetical protein
MFKTLGAGLGGFLQWILILIWLLYCSDVSGKALSQPSQDAFNPRRIEASFFQLS